jgi:hypothetical protein
MQLKKCLRQGTKLANQNQEAGQNDMSVSYFVTHLQVHNNERANQNQGVWQNHFQVH